MHAPPHSAQPLERHPRTLRLRTVVLLVILVPTLGMVGIITISISEALTLRDSAQQVDASAATLASIADARVIVVNEQTASSIIAFGTEMGVDVSTLSDFAGVDYLAQLDSARTAFDADELLAISEQERARVDQTRSEVDAGTATLDQAASTYDPIIVRLDSLWDTHLGDVQAQLTAGNVDAPMQDRVMALRISFALQRWGTALAAASTDLARSPTHDPAIAARFFDASSRHQSSAEAIAAFLGPGATEAWERYGTDPGVISFNRALDEIEQALLVGSPTPQLDELTDFASDFFGSETWINGLNDLVGSAAQDLRDEASHQHQQAARDLRTQVAAAGALTILTLIAASLLVRSVNRPVQRLAGAADQIRKGTFTLEPIDAAGPRELANTARAFNEMATTLASVETYATTLADEPEHPLLDHPIPGRTGQALQVALNRLRSSIRQAEHRREELEVVATHDALTGLLNRSAALLMIERDLAAAERSNGVVMALFIDLDEFKSINDQYGHAAGDDALDLVAAALREATRQADVVARIGGDEFLVAGEVTDDPSEVERLAERIRSAIGSARLGTPDGPIGLHCSIGVALSHPGDDVDQLVQRADAAMYAAKRQGPDHIAWARPDRPEPSST